VSPKNLLEHKTHNEANKSSSYGKVASVWLEENAADDLANVPAAVGILARRK